MPRRRQPPAGELPAQDSDDWVEVIPVPQLLSATARALLDKATSLGYDPQRAVISVGHGFRVPADLLDATTLPTEPLPEPKTWRTPSVAVEKGAIPDATK